MSRRNRDPLRLTHADRTRDAHDFDDVQGCLLLLGVFMVGGLCGALACWKWATG